MSDDERAAYARAWKAALQAQFRLGELYMQVNKSPLRDSEKAELNGLIGNLQAQFKAVGKVMEAASEEELYKQAIASADRLLERTEHAIDLLNRLIAKQSK